MERLRPFCFFVFLVQVGAQFVSENVKVQHLVQALFLFFQVPQFPPVFPKIFHRFGNFL